LRTSLVKLHLQENPHMIEEMKNLKENISQEAASIHAMLQTGQQSAQEFIDYNNVDVKKLIAYIQQYKGEPREIIIRDIITGNVRDYNPKSLKQFKDMFLKKIKNKNMRINEFKSLVREVVKKKLAENQPAPSRETPERGTETIPDRGTEEEKKRRRIGNPNVEPRPKAMNENEQEIIKQIVARFKSNKLNETSSKINLTSKHQAEISAMSPERKKKLASDLADAATKINDKEFKTKAEYAAAMKDAKTTVYKNYIKL